MQIKDHFYVKILRYFLLIYDRFPMYTQNFIELKQIKIMFNFKAVINEKL